MKSKHTPGPWVIGYTQEFELEDGRTNIERRIDSRSCTSIAKVYGDEPEDLANAKLIAAAPELLKELQKIYDALIDQGWSEESRTMHGISEAIKKATT